MSIIINEEQQRQSELADRYHTQSESGASFVIKNAQSDRYEDLTGYELSNITRHLHANKTRAVQLQAKIDNAQAWFNSNAEFYMDEPWFAELAQMLGLELTKDIEVTVEASWTLTLQVPLNFDSNDLTSSDFTVEVTYDGEGELAGVEEEDVQIS